MVRIEVDRVSMDRVRTYLRDKPAQINRVIVLAVNDTLRQQRTRVGRRIREFVNIKARDINPHIRVSRKANKTHTSGTLRIEESERLNLSKFGAKVVDEGVTAKIDKRGKRKLYPGAFMGPYPGAFALRGAYKKGGDAINIRQYRVVQASKLRGNVFRRKGNVSRLPIVKVGGVSPWGAYVKNPSIDKQTLDDTQKMLVTHVRRRLRFVLLKEAGAI